MDGDCWIFTGHLNSGGYGLFWFEGKMRSAHIVSYELLGEHAIDTGLELDHTCRNRACINPAHLEQVTHIENIHRGEGLAAINKRKTHCIHNHPLSGDNLIRRPGGNRGCKACRDRSNKNRTKKKVI